MLSLESTTIGNGKQPATASSTGSELERLPRRRDDRSLARREPVYGMRKTSAVEKRRWEEREAKSTPKEGGARFSYSHVGVRRRELLYNMVTGEEAEGSRDAEVKKRKEFVAVKSSMKDGETSGGVKVDEMEVEEEL